MLLRSIKVGTVAAVAVGCALTAVAAEASWERPTGELQATCQAICDWAVRENLQGALQFVAYKD